VKKLPVRISRNNILSFHVKYAGCQKYCVYH
jgi:hypothetical protein